MRSITLAIRSCFGIVLLLGILSGCDTVPRSMQIRPVSLNEVHGQTGHLIEIKGGTEAVAFRADRWDDTNRSPIFVIISYDQSKSIAKTLAFIAQASALSFRFDRPAGVPLLSTEMIGQTRPGDPIVYLTATVNDNPVYVKIVTEDRLYNAHHNAFHAMVSKPAQTIQLPEFPTVDPPIDYPEGPSREFMDWLTTPLDPAGGPTPEVITEVPLIDDYMEPDIGTVRKKQEELLSSTYGTGYRHDEALRRALRIGDRINERFLQAQVRWLIHRDYDVMFAEFDVIQQEESGLAYFTHTFTSRELVLGIYLQVLGDVLDTQYGIVAEYLRLHFTHPGENEEQLLKHFRRSVKNRLILPKNPWRLW